MNRAQRRAEKAISKRQPLAKYLAIHEAGHAVARILTAEDFGRSADECVIRIDIEAQDAGEIILALDGSTKMQVGATCFGLMFSKEIDEFLKSYFSDGLQGFSRANLREREGAFAEARRRGVAVDRWLRARLLIDVFGAAAEAKFLEVPAADVWNSSAAEGDFKEAAIAARMGGCDTDEASQMMSEALDRAVSLLEQTEVWRAVEGVAGALPNRGSIAGSKVFQIASRALGSTLR
jgi:hypothetical protein